MNTHLTEGFPSIFPPFVLSAAGLLSAVLATSASVAVEVNLYHIVSVARLLLHLRIYILSFSLV